MSGSAPPLLSAHREHSTLRTARNVPLRHPLDQLIIQRRGRLSRAVSPCGADHSVVQRMHRAIAATHDMRELILGAYRRGFQIGAMRLWARLVLLVT